MLSRPMRWLTPLLAALLCACASGPSVDRTYKATSQDSRIQFIVIHFTSTGFNESLSTLTAGPVSSHYLVRDDPVVVVPARGR